MADNRCRRLFGSPLLRLPLLSLLDEGPKRTHSSLQIPMQLPKRLVLCLWHHELN